MPKFYLTTPIFYVNDVPHIGHAYSTINADAIARWHRLIGDDVFFMTGTDEHGLKVQRAAEANGITPKEQADQTSQRFKESWELLDISHDYFMRTTQPSHHKSVQKMLTRCYENGYIYKSTYDGLYSVSDESYVSQEDVDAGLIQGEVERMVEDNYFFKLSAFTEQLLEWYESVPDNVAPQGYKNEALGIIKGGLEDLSISRTSLTWGVKVPWDENHVFYVWYDALINYATAIGYGAENPENQSTDSSGKKDFNYWWPATHHIVGKDILRFHCVYWPAMLLAAGIEDLPKVRVHGWLLVGGDKMSKSKLNQIAPSDLVEDFGVDGFRFCLLRDNPFGPDSDFSYEEMQLRYNSDLANGLGNLLGRVTTLVETKCDGVGPAPDPKSPLGETAAEVYEQSKAAWEKFHPANALQAVWKLVSETNEMLTKEEPWNLEPGEELNLILGNALEAIRIIAFYVSPVMPATAQAVYDAICVDSAAFLSGAGESPSEAIGWGKYVRDSQAPKIKKIAPLFPKK